MKNFKHSSIQAALATLLGAFALSGCGSPTFDVVQSQESAGAGSMNVPSKVDIVLAVDDSGSTATIRSALNASLGSFMNSLQTQNWDYRITAIPLTRVEALSQITTSKHDPNWGSQWTAPYPGAPQTGGVPASLFRLPQAFTIPTWQQTTGEENGLLNIGTFLRRSDTQNSFIRKDALLATIVFSNGNDTSDGVQSSYPYNPVSTVSASVLNGIRNAKGTALASTVKLYAAVNTGGNNVSCLGSNAWSGSRYMSAAGSLGGESYNLCSGNFTQILSSMATHLQGQQLNFTTTYLFLEQEPNLNSVRVYKNSNGSTVEVPRNSGWTYLGYRSNFPAITQPVAMNYKSGYVIQLLGNYQLQGSDTATVDYLPAGVQPSP